MNLVQIQDHLRGLPTQALMAYANGQNPEVPPYLALGVLNQRKQMEQAPAHPAQGSVKEQIEQSLMQPKTLPGIAAQGVPTPQPPQPPQPPGPGPKTVTQTITVYSDGSITIQAGPVPNVLPQRFLGKVNYQKSILRRFALR